MAENNKTKPGFDLMMAMNVVTTLDRATLASLLNGTRDIDAECKYPVTITAGDYRTMFDRNGLAERVVKLWPEESWQVEPEVYETEEADETEFEAAVAELTGRLSLWSVLARADILSGIGQFGILLLGLDDGKSLSEPVDGINALTGEKLGTAGHKLLYLRPFDQSCISVKTKEANVSSPRYGQPTMYTLTFESGEVPTSGTEVVRQTVDVHWTRVIHLADNREVSDIYGKPRMQSVYNNLLDVKKISGGSGEMFWKGGFPGFSFELTPKAEELGATIDTESLKEQMQLYMEGLQRYLSLTGVTAKSLAPQVADPSNHLDWHVKLIAIEMGVPYRILLGTEEAKLASSQDTRRWNGRVAKRQNSYLTPLVIRPFFDRLIILGALPEVEQYFVDWPDLNAQTDAEVADVAMKRTDSLAKYVAGGVEAVIPPSEFLTMILGFTVEEADAIEKAAAELQDIVAGDKDESNDAAR
jgi:hypothetical protein